MVSELKIAGHTKLSNSLRMALNRLPDGCDRIRREVAAMRAALESAMQERDGPIGAYQAAVVQSACRWETVARLCAKWLREAGDSLTHAERLAYASKIATASTERDKCLERLGLHTPPDPFAHLYDPLPVPEPEPAVVPSEAPPDPWAEPPEPGKGN